MDNQNSLGQEKISKLIIRFAVPGIIGMTVGALYNIINQIFIGQIVGHLGTAATNVDFPIAVTALAAAVMFGIGGASGFNLSLGEGDKDRVAKIAGNSILWITAFGVVLTAVVKLFQRPLLLMLGATEEVLPYAMDYTGIMAFGLPFSMLSVSLSHLIRADGRPKLSMLCMVTGCVLNIILAAVFMLCFGMGVKGAATATVISQFVSAALGVLFIMRLKSAPLRRECFKPDFGVTFSVMKLGAGPFFNQFSFSILQIVLNNSLKRYGAQSEFGSDIPLAVAGIIGKTNMLFFSVAVGISQGCQPLMSYNFGAKKYGRVRQTLKLGTIAVTVVSCLSFLCYQFFPRQLVGVFGPGDELYFEFAVRYFRIFLFLAFINGIQPLFGNFFTSIGKAFKGAIVAMTRFVFFIPLVLILPSFFGIDGVIYSGPASDAAAVIIAVIFTALELRAVRKLENGDDAPQKV